MSWAIRKSVCTLLSVACVFSSCSVVWADNAGEAAKAWEQTGWPLLETYCLDCHNKDTQEAEVDLSVLSTLDGVRKHGDLATHVVSIIRFGAMPPEDADVPDTATRRQLADGLDNLVFHGTCDLRPRPGRTTARRLNRAEYNNAIRDLFGMDLRPADSFPADEVGAGFDNNADVLSLSPMLMEKYLNAAEGVTKQILVDPETLPYLDKTFADSTLNVVGDSVSGRFGQRYLTEDGLAWVEFEIEVGGEYTIEFRASPSYPSDGKRLATIFDGDAKLRSILEFDSYDSSGRDDYEQFKVRLEKGTHRFYFKPDSIPAKDRKNFEKSDWKIGETVDQRIQKMDETILKKSVLKPGTEIEPTNRVDKEKFIFRVKSVVVRGPSSWYRDDLPPSQREILKGLPSYRGGRWTKVEDPAKKSLAPIMRIAFRREIDDDDLQPYVDLVANLTNQGQSYYEALRTAIGAILVSPRFLFRIEVPESESERVRASEGDSVPLSSPQLATRLSFFLWSSLPNAALLDAAKRNELVDPKKRKYVVERLLRDDRIKSLGRRFAHQWFGLGNLSGRDLSEFAEAGAIGRDEINTEMLARETEELFLHLLKENRQITELLTAEYTFVNKPLAKWYGMDTKNLSNVFSKVNVTDQARRGLLGHAGVLLLTSYPTRNSPVQRGKWILENVLGTPPPEAPPGVPGLEETQVAAADATLREQLELHRADPGCAACHRVMDSLGFGLETFDHLGRLRDQKDAARQDAHGELPGGRNFVGADGLSQLLAKTESRKLAETAVRRMLTFAIGRELRPSDRCFIESILDDSAEKGYRVRDLLVGVIESQPFLNHQAEPTTQVATVSQVSKKKDSAR